MSDAQIPTPTPRTSPPTSLVARAALAVLVVGVVLRLLGFFDLELWADEAGWCVRLIEGDYGWIRPIGYMWLTKQLLALHVSDQVLRSLSYVAGLAQLPIVYFVLKRVVTRPAFAVVGLWLLAIHPIAVAMTKEFKPYALEMTLHASLVALALAYLAKRTAPLLIALCVVAAVAPLFAWTIVFAYPGVFSVVGLAALRDKRIGHVALSVLGVVATLAMLAALFMARLSTKKPAAGYWGQKYDVFYIGDHALGLPGWLIEKTAEIATFPAHLELVWPSSLNIVFYVVGVTLCALGVIALVVRKQWALLALLVLPWLLTLAFNVAGVWPYGKFRTNVFLLFYSLSLVVVGLDYVAELVRTRQPKLTRVALVIAGILALATFPWEVTAFAHKRGGTLTAEASVRKALERIYLEETGKRWDEPVDDATAKDRAARAAVRNVGAEKGERAVVLDEFMGRPGGPDGDTPLLVMDGHACTIARYYRDFHDDTRRVFHDWVPSHFVTKCVSYGNRSWKQLMHELPGRSFWLISAKSKRPPWTRKTLAEHCDVLVDEVLPEWTHLYRCRAKAGAPVPTSPAAAPEVDDDNGADDANAEHGDDANEP